MDNRGRQTTSPAEVRAEMLALREEGLSLPKIAKHLNNNGVPTPGGAGEWYAQNVRQAILAEQQRRATTPPRSVTITFPQISDEKFAWFVHAVYYAAGAAGPHFEVDPGGSIDVKALNKVWRAGRPWEAK